MNRMTIIFCFISFLSSFVLAQEGPEDKTRKCRKHHSQKEEADKLHSTIKDIKEKLKIKATPPLPLKEDYFHLPKHNFSVIRGQNGHLFMRSKMLGAEGILEVREHLQNKGIPHFKSIIFLHKEGFNPEEPESRDLALEEYLLQGKLESYARFYSGYGDIPSYIDGKNPLAIKKEEIEVSTLLSPKAQEVLGFPTNKELKRKLKGDENNFFNVLRLALDKRNQPVLIHCHAGAHRTGMVMMALRYLEGGEWVNGKKRKVVIERKGKMHEIELSPLEYEYYQHSPKKVFLENIEFVRTLFTAEEFKSTVEELRELYVQ